MQRRACTARVQGVDGAFAVDGDYSRAEAGDEFLKTDRELIPIKLAKHSAESIVAGNALLQLEKAAEDLMLCLGKDGHVDGGLATRQTAHKAFIKISSRSWRLRSSDRGSLRPAKQASNLSITFSATSCPALMFAFKVPRAIIRSTAAEGRILLGAHGRGQTRRRRLNKRPPYGVETIVETSKKIKLKIHLT